MFDEIETLETDDETYAVERRLHTDGKHGISFAATRLRDKERVFVKMPSLDSRLSANSPLFQKRLKHLSAKFDAEAANAQYLVKVSHIARVLDSGEHQCTISGKPIKVPFLVQEFVEGISLAQRVADLEAGRGFLGFEADLWLTFAEGILSPLQSVHENGVVHGDLHLGNILIRSSDQSLVIVDFGESFIRDAKSHKREPGYGDKLAAPEKRGKRNMLTKGPWEAPSDIYSFGAFMYRIACGEELPDSICDHGDLPHNDLHDRVEAHLRRCNPRLLHENPCILQILLLALKPNPHERATARQLLDYVRIVRMAHQGPNEVSIWPIENELRLLAEDAASITRQAHPLVETFLRMNIERFGEKIRQLLRYGRFEMSGDRTEMLNHLQAFLATLGTSDMYWSVTHPGFWQPSNLGIRGRFYDLNMLLGRRRVPFRRLFVVSKEDSPDEYRLRARVFRAHRKLAIDLEAHNIDVRSNSPHSPLGFFTGVVERGTREEVRDVLESGYLVGFALIRNEPYSLTFRSEGSKGVVRRIAIQRIGSEEFGRARAKFEALQKEAVNILDWADSNLESD